ncbi:MAG TPA: hypothetical protein VF932_04590 [Anaerolineae bacterium]
MIQDRRAGIATWIAPALLLALVAVFIAAPWSLKGKLDAVCFGI